MCNVWSNEFAQLSLKYWIDKPRVLEVGSFNVNGSVRDVCQNLAEEYKVREDDKNKKLSEASLDINEYGYWGNIEPRPMGKLDEDIHTALKKMDRKRRLMCFLPGFDCAACGAPDCQTLADDVVRGDAQLSHCIFMQQQMIKQNLLNSGHALRITETIWGKERLNKNCNKIGAEDENS